MASVSLPLESVLLQPVLVLPSLPPAVASTTVALAGRTEVHDWVRGCRTVCVGRVWWCVGRVWYQDLSQSLRLCVELIRRGGERVKPPVGVRVGLVAGVEACLRHAIVVAELLQEQSVEPRHFEVLSVTVVDVVADVHFASE